jgi:hypothetical protein
MGFFIAPGKGKTEAWKNKQRHIITRGHSSWNQEKASEILI